MMRTTSDAGPKDHVARKTALIQITPEGQIAQEAPRLREAQNVPRTETGRAAETGRVMEIVRAKICGTQTKPNKVVWSKEFGIGWRSSGGCTIG